MGRTNIPSNLCANISMFAGGQLMSKSAIDVVIDNYSPCGKCGNKFIYRDYDEDGVVLYCPKCGMRFYPPKAFLKRIAAQVDGD